MDTNVETFIGRLGRNPELSYTKNKKAVCNLAIAVDQEGDGSNPIWKKVVVWERQAEQCSVHLKKGHHVFVHGVAKIKPFMNKEGIEKSYEEVTAKVVGFTNI
jgi:single-strand DNA-binding protein